MSDQDRIVIVGGGPAGFSAACAYRDAGGTAELVILSGEEHHPYSRPPLTKEYLRGEHGRDALFLEEPEWLRERGIDMRTGCAVARLDPDNRVVVTERGEELRFERCVLATGSEPTRPPVPGGDGEQLLTLRAMEDSERLQAQCAPGLTVTVVGSGFIGCEAAVSLAMSGCKVTLVSDEEVPQAARLGKEAGAILAEWLEEAGEHASRSRREELRRGWPFGPDRRRGAFERRDGGCRRGQASYRAGRERGSGHRAGPSAHRSLDAYERRRSVRRRRHRVRPQYRGGQAIGSRALG